MPLARRLALCAALAFPVPAIAQQAAAPSPDALQAQLQAWFAGVLGADRAANLKLRVTAEADHDRIAITLPGAIGNAETTAELRPRDGGRWSIEAIRLPAATKFTLRIPEHAGSPDGVPTDFGFSVATQESHAMFDPGFATPSSLDLDLRDIGLVSDSPQQHQEQHIDRTNVQVRLTPQDGRLDFDQDTTITGWRTATRLEDQPAMAFGADRVHASGRIAGVDRDRAAAVLSAIAGLLATVPADAVAATPGDSGLAPATRAALRACIEALRGSFTAMRGEETIDGLHVAVAGQGDATVRQMRLAADGSAPDGLVRAWLEVVLDGVALDGLPPSAASLAPTRIALRPSVAGVSLTGLTALMLKATEADTDNADLADDAEALLSHRGVTLGLESLSIDFAAAALHGHGRVVVNGPDDYAAEAHVTASGVDALMLQARGNPDLRQALPILAMVRGFARPEGDHLAWDIVAGNAGLTVNGIELSKPQGAPPDGKDHPRKR